MTAVTLAPGQRPALTRVIDGAAGRGHDRGMNFAATHLALNHVPVLGAVFSLLLYVWGLVRASRDLQVAALVALTASAVLAWPVFLSGHKAEEIVEALPGITVAAIETHESAALAALVALQVAGVAAIATLVICRARPIVGCAHFTVIVSAIVAAGLSLRAAGRGGEIRHATELRAASPAAAVAPDRD